MFQWYGALPPDQQAMMQGLVVMVLFAVIRAVAAWSGKPMSETAGGKFVSYLTVAVTTATTTLLTTGATGAFWVQWALALFTAVGAWEGLSKTYKPIKNGVENEVFRAIPYALVLVLAVAVTMTPAMAAPVDESPFSGTVIAALDDGPFFGAAISYQFAGEWWADVGVKRDQGGTDEFAGISTSWPLAQKTLQLFGINAPSILKGSRYGGGYLIEQREWMFYMARTVLAF